MERRKFLGATAIGAVAGCLADSSGSEPTFTASLSYPQYHLSMDDQSADVAIPGHVTDFEDVPDDAAAALETVIEAGTYETDDPDAALLEGVFSVQDGGDYESNNYYVEYEGTVYELDPELPMHVVSGREVPESELDPDRTISFVDERIMALEDDRETTGTAIATVVEGRDDPHPDRSHEYRAPIVEADLKDFLENYDYVIYPGDAAYDLEPEWYVELEVDYEDPGPPYTITVDELPDETRYGRSVTDVSDYPDDAATALRLAAARSLMTPPLQIDTRPDGIDEVQADEAFVRIDDDVYEPAFETIDREAVPVSTAVTDVDADERTFTLAVEADGEPVTFSSVTEHPTDPLVEVPDPTADDRESLEDGAILMNRPDHGGSYMIDLEAGETMTTTYEVRSEDGLDGGTHRLVSALGVEWDDGAESATYPFVVTLSVPEPDG